MYRAQGPCGEEWDDEYDGTIETPTPPFGNPRADGISLACMDSLVEGNVSDLKSLQIEGLWMARW
jgi:hypothetical protein